LEDVVFCQSGKLAAFLGTNLEPWHVVSTGQRNRSTMNKQAAANDNQPEADSDIQVDEAA